MSSIEPLELAAFARRLAAAPGAPDLSDRVLRALHEHYRELGRWAPRVDLIGPGAAGELFERHYGESLAALPWLPPGPFRLVDLGSGAGFPGLVLAAARPDAEVWLVEPRQRRAAFLAVAARKMGVGAHVLDVRVDAQSLPELPERIDVVTQRALRLAPRAYRALLNRLAPAAQLLVWCGAEPLELPAELAPARTLHLPHSRQRRLIEYRRAEGSS
ncbi:MAG TPA: RsmG family class I SAM-dependent methyltransferase [Thermoanaerobaculia bacterium]|nr:RsmG family class I SAM-dependent methyltransferase [Thermoanaerobaculia bacterium]